MKDLWIVARWEFLRSIRNKAFLITTLLVPVIILVAGIVPQMLAEKKDLNLVVIDETSKVYSQLAEIFPNQGIEVRQSSDLTLDELKEKAKEEKKTSYLYIPNDFFESKKAYYYFQSSSNINNINVPILLDQMIKNHELKSMGLTQEMINRLEERVNVERFAVDQDGDNMEEFMKGQVGMIVFGFMMVFTSMMAGSILLQSIIKEKNDRIVEVLLSSVSSMELMAGKIIGSLFVGISQLAILVILALGVAKFGFHLELGSLINNNIIYSFIYGILALVLIYTLYAFLGAIMKEVQSGGQAQLILTILPVVPMWFIAAIMENPFGMVARVLSYIPPCTPMTMMLRLGITKIPLWEIGSTLLVLLVFDIFMVYFVSRIFKTGLLMYGKSAGFKEAWKWFKQAN
ncbi:MAG: ABC transporter permease [Halanaerobiales bacterium]|nr:ABC transporter permease [Halanaerobiales bacterium]